jgi:asparagine synthase (glutamine-hydrolysing)
MCGIAGIVGNPADRNLKLRQMLDVQHHRGPDATQVWSDSHVILGHNRLSIIDLSEAANQPMVSACGRWVIVFNGEIYNYLELKKQVADYPFRTQSDTEVLLALYRKKGAKMLDELNGMFAFAIWDHQERQLFAARDRFGVKPFYYTTDNGVLYFASEPKGLFAAGIDKTPNEVVWADYFVHGSYGYPNETFYKSVHQLPAGHTLIYHPEGNAPQIQKYYDFVANVQNQPVYGDEQKLQADYLEILIDVISLRFRADVPVGFNVSGGLDSSILLALIAAVKEGQTQNIEAFTFYTGDERYDELPWVKKLIAKTSNPLNAILLQAEEVPALSEKVAHYQDEPYGGFPTLAYAKIFEAARQKGIIVLLDGQGMDEAWAGYDYYQTDSQAVVQGVKSSPTRPDVLSPDFAAMARTMEYPQPFDNALQNKQYRDLFYTKIPRALRFNDRISMMHSTELREPFLDYRLIEMAFAQKPEVKIKNGQGKWLLRQLVRQSLGEIALAPKRPLQTPQREWMAGTLKDWMTESIGRLQSHPWMNGYALKTECEQYFKQPADNSFYMWQWLSLSHIS